MSESENKSATSLRVTGYLSIVFHDFVSESEVNSIYKYLKKKFSNFYADSIECSRYSINVTLNYVTDDSSLSFERLCDQIRELMPNKISTFISIDGLKFTTEE